MALIACSECSKELSDKAEICPHCGIRLQGISASDLQKKIVVRIIAKLFVGITVLVAITWDLIGIGGPSSPSMTKLSIKLILVAVCFLVLLLVRYKIIKKKSKPFDSLITLMVFGPYLLLDQNIPLLSM